MANTTNLNLGKLSGSEKLKTFPTMQAGNMDTIDSAFGSGFGVGNASDVNSELNSLGDGLAIIANGDAHAAITSGQYVYVRKHGTLEDGLYTANSNISANATLSSSNLTANTNGGLNNVYSTLNTKLNTLLDGTINTVFNVDLNDYKTPGAYYFATGCSNAPGNYFLCIVIAHATDIVIQFGMYAASKTVMKFRLYSTGSWGEWKTLTGT